MLRNRCTSKFKLKWLAKRKAKYINTMSNAFHIVKKETLQFLNGYKGPIDAFVKFLVVAVETEDPETFIQMIEGVIKDAQKAKEDTLAKRAIIICKHMLFRLHCLSRFTYFWTNVTVRCSKCGRLNKTNFLYTNKLCDICGSIIL